jgi:hypothetical protein
MSASRAANVANMPIIARPEGLDVLNDSVADDIGKP